MTASTRRLPLMSTMCVPYRTGTPSRRGNSIESRRTVGLSRSSIMATGAAPIFRHVSKTRERHQFRSDDYGSPKRHQMLQISVGLQRAGIQNAERPLARNQPCSAWRLANTGCKNGAFRDDAERTSAAGARDDNLARKVDRDNRASKPELDTGMLRAIHEAACINWSRQDAAEFTHAERRMSAVTRNPACLLFAVDDDDVRDTEGFQLRRRGETGRAGADDDHVGTYSATFQKAADITPRPRPPEAMRSDLRSAQRAARCNRSPGIGPCRTACDA